MYLGFLLPLRGWKDVYLRRTWFPPFSEDVREIDSWEDSEAWGPIGCSPTLFITDRFETSNMGINVLRFIWYSYSMALPVIVAVGVRIFTFHGALVHLFFYGSGKDKACPSLVRFHFPKYGVGSDFENML